MQEIWKFYIDNRCYRKNGTVWNGGYYEVSNFGRVKKNGEIAEPRLSRGYLYIGGYPIYRMVAEAFIPNPENKPCVDHINTIKTDNRASNLQWVTYSENNSNPITKARRNSSLTGKKRGPHSEQTKQNMRKPHLNYNPKNHNKANLGRIHVSKNGINKMIPKEKIEQYLNEGYILGWVK